MGRPSEPDNVRQTGGGVVAAGLCFGLLTQMSVYTVSPMFSELCSIIANLQRTKNAAVVGA